jgi:hypothetical protein
VSWRTVGHAQCPAFFKTVSSSTTELRFPPSHRFREYILRFGGEPPGTLPQVTRSVGGSVEHTESYAYNLLGALHTSYDLKLARVSSCSGPL